MVTACLFAKALPLARNAANPARLRRWRPSLKVARLEDDTGTSRDPLPRAPVVSDWQRRDGGGATRVGRCREGDSGSQRPLNRAPSADEMTASSRRTRWRHRREPATRACGAHGKFEGFASGPVGTNLSDLEKKYDLILNPFFPGVSPGRAYCCLTHAKIYVKNDSK